MHIYLMRRPKTLLERMWGDDKTTLTWDFVTHGMNDRQIQAALAAKKNEMAGRLLSLLRISQLGRRDLAGLLSPYPVPQLPNGRTPKIWLLRRPRGCIDIGIPWTGNYLREPVPPLHRLPEVLFRGMNEVVGKAAPLAASSVITERP